MSEAPQKVPNPVADYYRTWWISPEGEVFEAVEEGVPGHCAWLEKNYGICTRPEARAAGWVRVGWNMTRFYIDGRPERVEAERANLERLIVERPIVNQIVMEKGSDLDAIVTPQQFFELRPR